jgi:energy-coupling factor transporter ATP-binding protein EcfA2
MYNEGLMLVRRIVIRNVRSIAHVDWRAAKGQHAGWNVILGDNGSGKSSFLRALALAMIGPKDALAARQDWTTWLRSGADLGSIVVEVTRNTQYDFFSGKGKTGEPAIVAAGLNLVRGNGAVELLKRQPKNSTLPPERHLWGAGNGWFSAAYGPFRRFAGGDNEAERAFHSNPKLGAHISVFGENVALTETLYWLRELNYKKLEDDPEGELLNHLKAFVNQNGFLPHDIHLRDVSSKGVDFEDASGFPVSVQELSDGYRSILSMTFELIRQVARSYPNTTLFDEADTKVIVPGVVLIDEIDAHLHPSWQKKVGFWLTEHFPMFQFFVTTHSPLICQAAIHGSIFALPLPGTDDSGCMLSGPDRDRLVYGDILEAYSTMAFGTAETRSSAGYEMQERLAVLNVKEIGEGLSVAERQEQELLRSTFATSPHVASVE